MAEARADDPRIGATLAGKYAITRLIGRGAFGAVYEATNVELEKRVAVKLIEPRYVTHEEVVARFRVEAKAASRVESEHIVQVFDVGNDDDHGLYMVMEMLHGEDLADRLDREFKLSPAVAVHIAVQAARGLGRAHAAGVVHRDLKPANLFLITREDGSLLVKIVDFGISKLLGQHEPGERALTRTGTAVGTPNYMSPEQARGLEVDGRTDVWALGAVLYEMLAGTPAYPHEATYEDTVIAIATGPEPRLLDIAAWVPADVASVCDRALTRDLHDRIQDCTELARLLSEAMPNATRPRREESLYMEPSDFSDEPKPPSPPAAGVSPRSLAEDDQKLAAARRAETTIAATRKVEPARARRVWPWVVVPLLAAGLAVAAWKLRPAETAAPPPAPSTSESVSAAPSVSASVAKPIAHPKPKPTAKPSSKPSAKPSVSAAKG